MLMRVSSIISGMALVQKCVLLFCSMFGIQKKKEKEKKKIIEHSFYISCNLRSKNKNAMLVG